MGGGSRKSRRSRREGGWEGVGRGVGGSTLRRWRTFLRFGGREKAQRDPGRRSTAPFTTAAVTSASRSGPPFSHQ